MKRKGMSSVPATDGAGSDKLSVKLQRSGLHT